MSALKKAIQIEQTTNSSEEDDNAATVEFGSLVDSRKKSGIAVALVRLLIKPRDEKSKDEKYAGVSKSSSKHPRCKDFNSDECDLYNRVKIALDDAAASVNFGKENLDNIDGLSQSSLVLGNAHYTLGNFFRKLFPEEIHRVNSVLHYQTMFQVIPESETIVKKSRFWLASLCTNAQSSAPIEVNRCPEEYIISLYSSFASRFDKLLVQQLQYETPVKLRDLVTEVKGIKSTTNRYCADLGCGTGLSGLAFRDCVDSLIGIDLSPEMIQKAKEKKCYDELRVGDVETIFCNAKGSMRNVFNLVIACDVFVYIGDLRSVFISVRQNLCEEDGLIAFSTEFMKEDTIGGKPYLLQKCARFAHKQSYIEELSKETGFEIKAMKKTVIRKNKGNDVNGLLVVLSCLV